MRHGHRMGVTVALVVEEGAEEEAVVEVVEVVEVVVMFLLQQNDIRRKDLGTATQTPMKMMV